FRTTLSRSYSTASTTSAHVPVSLHDALPIWPRVAGQASADRLREGHRLHRRRRCAQGVRCGRCEAGPVRLLRHRIPASGARAVRSEEHTSELQSRENLVCRLLLEKKKTKKNT